jgi:hypothetical protein
MALSVASGRPCLGRFPVPAPGPALVFAAEDAPLQVRERLEGLARVRGARFADLDVGLIVEPSLRLDRPEDLARLRATLDRRRPRLLVLDPYIRLQRADENNSTEVSAILGTLRDLSREFALAILLVHHARKSSADQAGQALRGSSDFHAWGDSNLYLARRGEDLVLSIEHRAAPAPHPLTLRLVVDDAPARLEIRSTQAAPAEPSLSDKILRLLAERGPCWQDTIRQALRVRKQDLTDVLRDLEASRRVLRGQQGWSIPAAP